MRCESLSRDAYGSSVGWTVCLSITLYFLGLFESLRYDYLLHCIGQMMKIAICITAPVYPHEIMAALILEQARGPPSRILTVRPSSFSSCGPVGPTPILLSIFSWILKWWFLFFNLTYSFFLVWCKNSNFTTGHHSFSVINWIPCITADKNWENMGRESIQNWAKNENGTL